MNLEAKDVLLIGAGAVGQVFALHLLQSGARVSFFVKEKHVETTKRGFELVALHAKEKLTKFAASEVITSVEGKRFDHVFLCVSSTGLDAAARVAASVGGGATVVAIQPGLDDPALLGALVPVERIVWGMFPLVAFFEGEKTKYWLPPFTKVPFSGARAKEIAALFDAGGLPSRAVDDVQRSLPFGSAVINLHMCALECAGWKFAALRQDRPLLKLMRAAMREAFAIIEKKKQLHAPWILTHLPTRLLTRIAPLFVPFDLQAYFEKHFGKVGDQTIAQLRAYGREPGAMKLQALAARLEQVRRG